ncbi:MAG: hypothetical protein KJZ83_14420, partial [Burkholderiaceae bacterium]|nr:hypothetical protein [Burkholderiaceae bacterium]
MPRLLSETDLGALSAQAWALLDAAQVVVADLDGCLASDNQPLPGAHEFVRRVGRRLVVASNNSTHSARQLARTLSGNGLHLPARRFILAGELAVRHVARQWPGATVMLLASAAIRAQARRAGLRLVDAVPEVVLLARATGCRFAQLEAADRQIQQLEADSAAPRGELLEIDQQIASLDSQVQAAQAS